ncbi:MAG TPA: zf-HC2 domain-containing protein [Candidatus Acidoferrales bacterium]|nr:zf-HC2 domain-containing protein [Candidatus Acidoferrales bacterium]
MECQDAQELITGLVDGELSREELSAVQAHLAGCSRCQWVYAEEQALKRELQEVAASIRAPAALRDKIGRDHRLRPRRARVSELLEKLFRPSSFLPQAAVFAATVVLLAVSVLYWSRSTHMPVAPGIFGSYLQIARGELHPVKTANIAELKEHLIRSVGGKFAPMGYDFAVVELWPVGGLAQHIANRQVLLTVYAGKGSMLLVCYTFLGSEDDAPGVAEVFFDREKGLNFYRFSHGPINAVMHREGEVMCVLVSQLPMDELLALAREKARVT